MSFDIFEENLGFWGTILALFMHNLPAIILLIVLIISWKREVVGGVVFVLGGILYAVLVLSNAMKTGFEWYYLAWIAQISGVALLIGILFFVGWFRKKKLFASD